MLEAGSLLQKAKIGGLNHRFQSLDQVLSGFHIEFAVGKCFLAWRTPIRNFGQFGEFPPGPF